MKGPRDTSDIDFFRWIFPRSFSPHDFFLVFEYIRWMRCTMKRWKGAKNGSVHTPFQVRHSHHIISLLLLCWSTYTKTIHGSASLWIAGVWDIIVVLNRRRCHHPCTTKYSYAIITRPLADMIANSFHRNSTGMIVLWKGFPIGSNSELQRPRMTWSLSQLIRKRQDTEPGTKVT